MKRSDRPDTQPTGKKRAKPAEKRRALVEELEPRLLLSADLGPFGPDLVAGATIFGFDPETQLGSAGIASGELSTSLVSQDATRELVFIDEGVEGYGALVEDLRSQSRNGRAIEVVVLDAERDGVTQISDLLSGLDYELDALHIVSHGTEAGVQLGNTWLDGSTLDGRSDAIAGWSAALGDEADLLFYGCDLAGSIEGQALVDAIAGLTGADVAASTDATGEAVLGGDWNLEYAAGAIETEVAFSQTAQRRFAGILDGTAIWAENFNTTPNANELDGAAFTGQYPTANVGEWIFIEEADAPTRDEKIVVGIDEFGKISGQMWDGTSWSALPFNAALPTISIENNGVAVAYEAHSGDAVLVYSNGTASADSLSYRVWDGASWSAEQMITTPFASEAHRVRVASSGINNEMVLIGSTANEEDFAVVWDGATWGNQIALHDGTGANWSTDISVAYEQHSGEALVAWGEDDLAVRFRQWTGTGWTAEASVAAPAGVNGALQWTMLAADPTSDRIALGSITSGRDAWVSVWDGSSWEPATLASNFLPGPDSGQRLAVTFEATSGQALAVWSETGFSAPVYRTWNGAWSVPQLGPDIFGQGRALRLDADRGTDRVMLSAIENGGNAVFVGWFGGGVNTWGAASVQALDAADDGNQPIAFSWDDGAIASALWLTTGGDVASGGQGGSDSWESGDLLQLGGPGFQLEPAAGGATQGDVTVAFDIERFAPGAATNAIHYVGSDIRIGSSSFQLRSGDLLLSTTTAETLTSLSVAAGGFTNNLPVSESDVFVFRPDTAGDYSEGSFALLLSNPSGNNRDVQAITLIEERTLVGDAFLDPGDFLFAHAGGPGVESDIWLFQTTDVGTASGGTKVLFLDGADPGVATTGRIDGLDVVEETTTIGGRVLRAGTLLVSSGSGGTVGGMAAGASDVVALDIGATTYGSGLGVVSPSLLFDGADVAFDAPGEELDGFSLAALANHAPVLAPSTPSLTPISEDDLTNPGDLVATLLGAVSDLDGGAMGGIAVTGLDSGNGTWQYQLDGGPWLDVGAVSPTNALLLRDIDGVRFVPDGKNGTSAGFDFRAWDQTEFRAGTKTDPGPGGGSSAFSTGSDTAGIAVGAVNDAPTVVGTAANQPIGDSSTIDPFTSVTIADVDLPADALTVTVRIDDPVKGALANLGSFSDLGGGSYRFLGNAAQATTAIRALTFDPAENRLAAGTTELATFTIEIDDGAVSTPVSDASTTVLVTGDNDAPVLSAFGPVLPTISEDDTSTTGVPVATLLGTSVSDGDPGAVEGIAITGFTATSGSWQYQLGAGAWTDVPALVSGTNALLLRDSDRVRFLPDGENAGGGSIGYRAWDQSLHAAGDLVDPGLGGGTSPFSTASDSADITTTAVKDLPTITGAVAGQTVADSSTIDPFQGVVIGDVDAPADTLSVTVELDDENNGVLANLGSFVDAGGGAYTFSGTAAAATTAIQALTFEPADGRLAPGQSETTTFTIEVSDGGPVQSDATTTVVSIAQNDGALLWTQNGNSVPQTSDWNGTAFGPIAPTADVGGQWLVMAGAESPHRDEKIVVGVDGAKTISGQIWDGSSWSSLGVLGTADGPDRWSFDVAYASQTGRAMVVYDDAVLGLSYRVWDGTAWSVGLPVAPLIPGPVDQMRLASSPVRDEMVLVVSTKARQDYAVVWDGTNGLWGNSVLLDGGAFAGDNTEVQAVYEQQSGRAMVLYGKGNSDASYRIWDGGWQPENTIAAPALVSGELTWADAAADPTSNRIVFGGLTADEDAWAAVWDGVGSWDARRLTVESAAKDAPNVAVAFDSQTGDALAVYGEKFNRVRYRTWAAGSSWSLEQLGPGLGNEPTSMTLDADPFTSTIMLTVQENGDKLVNAVAWDGTAWGSVNQLGTETGETKNQPFLFLWDQGDIVWSNTAPAILGTTANQPVDDTATVDPFQGVVIGDVDLLQTLTVTIALDDSAKGVLTNLGAFVDKTGGVYEFEGSAAAATVAIQALTFDPAENRVAVGATETTTFAINVDDGLATTKDTDTSVVATSINDAPTIAGAVGNLTVDDDATVDPFQGVVFGDADKGETVTVDIQLDDAAKGVLTNLGSFTDQTGGLYRFTGTAAAATTAVQGLRFDPTNDRVAVGASETTTFTISVDDGHVTIAPSDDTTTVVSTSMNDAPTIAGTAANQAVDDTATVDPFAAVVIDDVDPGTTVTVDIQLDAAAKGVLTNLGSFTDQTGGLYRFTGTAGAATTAIRALTFDPAENRGAVGTSETTTFTISVDDGEVATPSSDATTTVVSTSMNDAPTIAGTAANQAVDDTATVDPFAAVVIDDLDPGTTVTVDIQLDAAAKGVLTNLGSFTDQTGGLYRFTGTAGAATTAIRALTFDPTENRVSVGTSETTTFTISVDDGEVATPSSDATTTVVSTSMNDAPTIAGTAANQAVDDTATVDPFQAVVIDDVDPATTVTVDIQLDDAAKGVLTNLGSFTDQTGGLYRFTGTAGAATTAIQALTFDPAENRVSVGTSETTTFTISVDDGEVATPSSDVVTTVVATSINDAPTIAGTAANQPVDDDSTIDPFAGVVIGDLDPGTTVTVDVKLDDGDKGALTNLGGFSDLGGGLYRFTGTAGAATTDLQGMIFDPNENRVVVGSTETTVFTISVDDGEVATPTVDNSSSVVASVNDAPTISGTLANQPVNDTATVDPFQGVVLDDPDAATTLRVDIQLDDAARGVLTNLGGFSDLGAGLYRFTGTPGAATTAIQSLRFDPGENRVAVGSTETTVFTITVDDGDVATPVSDTTTTVVSTSMNDAPTVVGTLANQPVDDDATIDPFQGVVISDVDPGTSVTVDVQLDDAAKGALTNLGAFSDQGGGVYRFMGTAGAATTAIQALTFDPTDNRLAVGTSEKVSFAISVDDGSVSTPTGDTGTSVVVTSVNDVPTITGTVSNQPTTDAATIDPFQGVVIADPDLGEKVSVDVQLDDAAKGVLTNLGAFSDLGGGLYRFTGTPAAATAAIQALTFDPTENRVPAGSTETTTFTIRVDDGRVVTPTTDANTTVVVTSINDAPTIAGTVANQPVDDDSTVDPFRTVAIGDLDLGAVLTVDVRLDDAAKGVLTNLGAFSDLGGGLYRFVGTPPAATLAIQGLTFDPTENRVPAGASETTRFTITADDGQVSTPPGDNTTTVTARSVNDAPTLIATNPGLPGVSEDEITNGGVQLSSLVAGAISDADAGAKSGVAITNTVNGNGTWQYSSDGGASWQSVGPTSTVAARLLLLTDHVRFVPDGMNATTAGFQFRAWDQTVGTPGDVANTTGTGGSSAFSSTADAASIAVSAVNDAPSLGDAAATSAANPGGASIAGMFTGRFSDVDAGDALKGLAVVGNTADPATQGVWQYSSDAGANWAPIASVGDGPNALALGSGSRLRFVPAASFAGAPPPLIVRGLDQSYPGSFSTTTGGSESRVPIDTTGSGGISPIAGTPAKVSTFVLGSGIGVDPPDPDPTPDPDPDPTPDPDPDPTPDPDPDPTPDPDPDPTPDPDPDPTPDPTPDPDPDPDPDPGSDPPVTSGPPIPGVDVVDPLASEAETLDFENRVEQPLGGFRIVPRFTLSGYTPGETSENSVANLILGGRAADFVRELDQIQQEMQTVGDVQVRMVSASAALSTGLSVGYVVWLTRGGLLLASVLSSMPAWRLIDPIPVLAQLALARDDDDESLGSMVSREGPERPPDEDPDDSEEGQELST